MSEAPVRFGEVDLTTCDREPIHVPGSIQPHGVLLVIDRASGEVEQVAGDCRALLGADAGAALGRPLGQLLGGDGEAFLRAQLDTASAVVTPITRLGIHPPASDRALDVSVHALDGTAIVELEPSRGDAAPTDEPIAELRALLVAVRASASVDESCRAAAVALRSATGFDRAMVYRFLPDDSGVVVAEDARAGLESFLGLHYPASDIPRQARELYRRNWIRTIPDIDYVAAPLEPAVNPRTGAPIDMSHCALRSVSPIHVEYLRNMGVRASMSASIVVQDRLWGMLVLHHYAPRQVVADLRIACEMFAQIFSLHVATKSQAELSAKRLEARSARERLITGLVDATDIGQALVAWDLLRYVGAGGAAVYIDGVLHRLGQTPSVEQTDALLRWLKSLNQRLTATDCLSAEFPPAAEYAAVASGLMAVAVSHEPQHYLLWFRPEFGSTVRWAGDPTASVKVGPLGTRLTPRGSFTEWLEVTRLRSAPWSETEREAAEALRVIVLESILRAGDQQRRERAFAAAQSMAEELERRVAERTAQLRALASELEAAEERERRQIARDLHDDLGQTLAAARIRLTALGDDGRADPQAVAHEVGVLIDQAANSIRSLATQLAPAILHELGLAPALDWLGEEIGRVFGLEITVVDDGRPKPLSHDARSVLYRAVRELLINVAKHAQTDSAFVEAEVIGDRLRLRVSDQGVGFDPRTVLDAPHRGLGLISMRERLSLIGGVVETRSSPGMGTVVVLTVPLAGAEGQETR
ncbi:MAG: GAF domain-containing protein [Proteobacteria bacterium]|nr:GAF domain-containing protein [Pseudomonadota bacterium]